MKHRKHLEEVWRELCAGLDPDDGKTNDELTRGERKAVRSHGTGDANKSTLRLCAQVRRAIDLALAECGDIDLQTLRVLDVRPNPDARRLQVRLCPGVASATTDTTVLNAKVAAVAHRLSHATASAVHRKRAPRLTFVVLPANGEEVRDG